MNIAIVSPVKNRAWCLPAFLRTVRALDVPKKQVTLIFVDDGSTDGSLALLRDFARRYRLHYRRILILEQPGTGEQNTSSRDAKRWQAGFYPHLASLRDLLLATARAEGCDAVFSVDSDTLLAPTALSGLLAHGVPMVGTLQICDAHYIGNLGVWPPRQPRYINAGSFTRPGQYRAMRTWPLNTLTGVGVVGGCYLLGPEVVGDPTITYRPAGDYPAGLGEDLVFCQTVRAAGHGVYLDTTVRSIHIMDPRFMGEALEAEHHLFGAAAPNAPAPDPAEEPPFTVLIPFRVAGAVSRPHLDAVTARWGRLFPQAEVIVADDGQPAGPFNKAAAVNRGVARANHPVLILADADCWPDVTPIRALVRALAGGDAEWGYPYRRVVFAGPAATETILARDDDDTPADRMRPCEETGTDCPGFVVGLTRPAFDTIRGFDERYAGWGGEDLAMRHALRAIYGHELLLGGDMAHLWHSRAESVVGHEHYAANLALSKRYAQAASHGADAIAALVNEEGHGGHIPRGC